MKAKVGNDPHFDDIKRGRPIQLKYAQALHHAAGVLQGPCGLEEIEKFLNSLQEYQIVIVSADHGFQTIFRGPSAFKVLGVLNVGIHFHPLTSLKGFLGRDAFGVHCGKSYKTGGKQRDPTIAGGQCLLRTCNMTALTHQVDNKFSAMNVADPLKIRPV